MFQNNGFSKKMQLQLYGLTIPFDVLFLIMTFLSVDMDPEGGDGIRCCLEFLSCCKTMRILFFELEPFFKRKEIIINCIDNIPSERVYYGLIALGATFSFDNTKIDDLEKFEMTLDSRKLTIFDNTYPFYKDVNICNLQTHFGLGEDQEIVIKKDFDNLRISNSFFSKIYLRSNISGTLCLTKCLPDFVSFDGDNYLSIVMFSNYIGTLVLNQLNTEITETPYNREDFHHVVISNKSYSTEKSVKSRIQTLRVENCASLTSIILMKGVEIENFEPKDFADYLKSNPDFIVRDATEDWWWN
jgi:hypothetical protein